MPPRRSRTSKRPILAGILVASALALLIAGWFWRRPPGLGRPAGGLTPRDLNLVLVTLDTTRADRLGCYGYDLVATPRLDELARRGALFEQAHSSVPLTLPSHASIFTGKYPPAHGVRDNGGYFLAESEETLAEILKAEGFATGGFVSAFVLDRRWGIAQGFDRYFDDFDLSKFQPVSMGDIQRRGEETLSVALDWIREQAGRRFFAWIHFYDPHSPYEPPEPFATAYKDRPYVGEIAYADSLVGQLADELSGRGILGRTLVVVVGDHGESLGEHNESGHAFFVYGVSTHVPLIFAGPYPRMAGRRIPDVVRTIDVMPTVLDLLGIHHPPTGQGVSLVPLLGGGRLERPLTAYSESLYARNHFGWSDLKTLRTAELRFIEAPRPELYDVTLDPGETTNLAGERPLEVESMREQMKSLEMDLGPAAPQTAMADVDEETEKKLAALGYIGSVVDTSGKSSAELPDPKDKIDIVNRMHAAREDFLGGNSAASIEKLKKVIADSPEVIDAYFRLANAYFKQGEMPAALEMYRKTLELKPDHDWAVVGLANAYVELGRLDDAILGYRKFLERDPKNDRVACRLAETLLDAGRLEEAATWFERALSAAPDRAEPAVGLAAIAVRRKDTPGARRSVARALAIDPKVRNAHYNLALTLEEDGNPKEAAEEYHREIASQPHAYKARFNLSRLLAAGGDRDGQIRELKSAVEDNPDFDLGRFFLAKALLDAGDLSGAEAEASRALASAPNHYYAPLGHYVLADIFNRQGKLDAAAAQEREGRRLEERKLPAPVP